MRLNIEIGIQALVNLTEVAVLELFHQLKLWTGERIGNEALAFSFLICLKNCGHEHLLECLLTQGYLVADLHSDFEDEICLVDLVHHLEGCIAVSDESNFFEELDRITIAVEGVCFGDQELEKDFHLDFVVDHDVKVTEFELDGQTLPTMEWDKVIALLVCLVTCQDLIYSLPLHPKPRRVGSKHETGDVRQLVL